MIFLGFSVLLSAFGFPLFHELHDLIIGQTGGAQLGDRHPHDRRHSLKMISSAHLWASR